ncbi:hypothetical protein [Pseudomonas sp. 25 E 4]|nr:hypothetical protein [Pseudomonas sp. 25 E 4]
MAFQLNQRGRLLAPTADDTRQRGQQQVVDLGAVGSRGVLQKLARVLGVKTYFDLAAQTVLQATFGVVARQLGVDGLRLPVRQLFVERLRMVVQMSCPVLIGTGFGRQRGITVGLLQVFQQDAPRHAVHHQVVDHQQQPLGAIGHVQQGCAQQRAVRQVETALGFIAQGGQFSIAVGLGLPQRRFSDRRCVALRPAVGLRHKAQAQGVVMIDQLRQRCFKTSRREGFARGQQQGLVPVVTRRDRLGEKVLLHRGQAHLALYRALVNQADRLDACHEREAAHALILEQVARAKANSRLARAADYLDGDDRVAAQFEEVVVKADLFHAEHVGPDRRQGLLQGVFRWDKDVLRRGVRHRQCLAVELAIGGHR